MFSSKECRGRVLQNLPEIADLFGHLNQLLADA